MNVSRKRKSIKKLQRRNIARNLLFLA